MLYKRNLKSSGEFDRVAVLATGERTAALFAVAFLGCWSRINIGTHYLTDVVGGALTGVAAAVVTRLAYRENCRLDNLVTRIL